MFEIHSFLRRFFIGVISAAAVNISFPQISRGAQERDPFVSSIDSRKKDLSVFPNRIDLSKAVLKGIIWNDKRPVAIINEELVGVGDDWQGYKIEGIARDKVSISDGENTYYLVIKEDTPPVPVTENRAQEDAPASQEQHMTGQRYPPGYGPGQWGNPMREPRSGKAAQ